MGSVVKIVRQEFYQGLMGAEVVARYDGGKICKNFWSLYLFAGAMIEISPNTIFTVDASPKAKNERRDADKSHTVVDLRQKSAGKDAEMTITLDYENQGSIQERYLKVYPSTEMVKVGHRAELLPGLPIDMLRLLCVGDGVLPVCSRITTWGRVSDHGIRDGDVLQVHKGQSGGKPVITVYPLHDQTPVTITLTLSTGFNFTYLHPTTLSVSQFSSTRSVQWITIANKDGTLHISGAPVSYLF